LSKLKSKLSAVAKLLHQDPHDHNLSDQYFSIKKRYKKTIKLKDKQNKELILKKLDELEQSNSKKYWELINTFRKTKMLTVLIQIHF